MQKYYSVKLLFVTGILIGSLVLTACGKQKGLADLCMVVHPK